MKFIITLLICIGSLARLPAQPDASTADSDYAAYQKLIHMKPPGSPKEMGAAQYYTWRDANRQAIKSAAMGFYAAYPTDPRRWELVLLAVRVPPDFIKGFGPDIETKGQAAIIFDETAVADWRKQSKALLQALLASADATLVQRENANWTLLGMDFRDTTDAKEKGETVDFSGFRARFESHLAKYADLDVLPARAATYLGALERYVPGAAEPIWRQLAETSPNAALRDAAAKRVKTFELMAKPLELMFTAVDGRKVDLRNLRGKVVLIDFWATWCGPCIAELPNIKKIYVAYHDQGFEIVGIALENARLAANDTPEQSAEKMSKAKKVLAEFTAKEGMPWPQYFDGKFWNNEISTKYNIQSIPAMFLLDQEGKVVSTNARGESLEREVKRLLKL